MAAISAAWSFEAHRDKVGDKEYVKKGKCVCGKVCKSGFSIDDKRFLDYLVAKMILFYCDDCRHLVKNVLYSREEGFTVLYLDGTIKNY